MATRLRYFQAVAENAVKDITEKRDKWTGFLDTTARLYKYPFPDQLLIHAQKPEAVACAPIEIWNGSFKRWVRRGTKGIGLIDDSGSYPRIKYVFDVNDTEAQYNSPLVFLWKMRGEHKDIVLNHLDAIYDGVSDSFADSIRSVASQLTGEYYEDNERQIKLCAENGFFEDFDDISFGAAFMEALAESINQPEV